MADDLIVVVPGITGSALRRDDRVIWDLSVAAVTHGLARTAQVLEAMRLPEGLADADPDSAHRLDPVGLIQGWHLWPGFWAGAGYGRLLHRLRGLHGDPGRVVAFAYDWRLSNRATARRLQQVVGAKLARWRERPGHADGDPATLVDAALPDLSGAAARDAHRLHSEITAALDRNGPPAYERYAFGGRRQPTDQSVSSTQAGLRYHRQQRGTDHTGDGTVPLFSSVAPEDGTTAAGVFHAARHSGLQRNDLLLDQVIDKVNGVDLGATLAPPYELALDLPDVTPAGFDVPLTVSADLRDLRLHASVKDPDGAPLDAHIPVRPDGRGSYSATLQLPPGTWDIEVETVAVAPPARVGDVLIVSPADPARRH